VLRIDASSLGSQDPGGEWNAGLTGEINCRAAIFECLEVVALTVSIRSRYCDKNVGWLFFAALNSSI